MLWDAPPEECWKPRCNVLCQHSKNSVWISQLTWLQENFHKVVLGEEKSQAEPLGRMWPKFGFPKEAPCESQRTAGGVVATSPALVSRSHPMGSPAQNSRGICTCKGAARTAADGLFIRLMCQHDSNSDLDFMYWPIPSGKERGTGHKCDWMLLLHDAKEEQLLGLVHHFILWASFLPASSQNNSRKIIILLMVQENEHKRDGERCLKSLL